MPVPGIRFPCPVRRLSVQWNENQWVVVGDHPVPSMTLPASAALPKTESAVVGFWFEAMDGAGQVFYRQILNDPIHDGMEQFEEDGSVTRIRHGAAHDHAVTIEILVPDIPELDEVHVISSRGTQDEHPGKERGPNVTRSVIKLGRDYKPK